MKIGVPLEIMPHERRVAVTPETVRLLVDAGHQVTVENGAGQASGFSDEDYRKAGASLSAALSIWQESEIVMKVKEPLFVPEIGAYESDLQSPGSCLVAFLHPANHPELAVRYAQRNLTAISMDCIPRVNEAKSMDALSSMSLIAGYKAVILAADCLDKMMSETDTPVAPLQGARVLIVGFGVVGVMAAKTALGLGSRVSVVDVRDDALERAKAMGANPVKVSGDGSDIQPVRDAISPELPHSDVVILSALVFGERAPILLTGEMLKPMRRGSVVVDVSVDQGGNCEVVTPGQITEEEGVTIIGILNLPGRLPVHSTILYSRNVANFVLHLTRDGNMNMDDPIVRGATVTHNGQILHLGTLKAVQSAASTGT